MGMDLFGMAPANKHGAYFRANIWSWPAIWETASLIASQLTAKVEHPWHNDGDGLNADDARELGFAISTYLEFDPVGKDREQFTAYEKNNTTRIAAAIKGQVARLIADKGKTVEEIDEVTIWPPEPDPGVSPHTTSREHLEEFATFLIHCGGFEIH